ncbi:hypothetical protein [Paraglaciecola sp. MB-3u-78]|jgi:uncharacterized membrane protein|uniref:hypothetical protein n=1 Tax=Paraglaciecola sp. MB-3u-78 TaxID=2058332 RepID=UPI000C34630B|nr:hypothetical protein [Paraglaciecola sp. MB-3u-78]PKH00533.1 hypothetical protein CXF95_03110 [Paraglaciecola sp. MB-3u-78]
MNRYSNLNSGATFDAKNYAKSDTNSDNYNHSLHAEHYSRMDLCSQAQMSENADNILNRMDKLRAFAREQQAKRLKSQRQQISFCF